VELYASFNRTELLQFLKTSNNYNLEKARVICEKKNYIQELVFIFSRMGDNKRALTLIMDNLEDVELVIEFVRGVGDEELWDDLVEQAKTKPGAAPRGEINGSVY
jgi:vacuolar protein sorting-associated protein 41